MVTDTDDVKDLFVETSTYHEAKEILEKTHIVVISGSVGQGKTFLANRLVHDKRLEGYKPKTIELCSEWKDRICRKEKQVILLDDIFTKTFCCGKREQDAKRLLCKIRSFLDEDSDPDTSIFIILTARPDVLQPLRRQISIGILHKCKYEVSLNDTLSFQEKMQMYCRHKERSAFGDKRQNETLEKTICNCDCPCFPICVKYYFQKESYYRKGLEFFENPIQIIQDDIDQLYQDDREVFEYLTLLCLHNGEMDESTNVDKELSYIFEHFECLTKQKVGQMQSTIARISSVYIQQKNRKVKFQHNSIFQAVCMSFSSRLPDKSLLYLPFEFICNRVRIKPPTESVPTEEEYLNLPKQCFSFLVKRFFIEIENNNIQHVCRHQAFSSDTFLCDFITELGKLKGTEFDRYVRILQSTERDNNSCGSLWNGCLLYWTAVLSDKKVCSRILRNQFYDSIKDVDPFFVSTQASATLVEGAWRRFDIDLMKCLINLGGNVNSSINLDRRMQVYNCDYCTTQDPKGITVLQASVFGDEEVNCEAVNFLLEKRARFREDVSPYRPLTHAIRNKNDELFDLLLTSKCDLNSVDLDGNSPLWYAVETDNILIARKIIESKTTKTDVKDVLFLTTSIPMTKLLVDFYKIDCSAIINQHGRNPLHTTISAELVNYFCTNGCKINQEDELGRTPLFYACSQDVAKAFLENKADVRHIDHEMKNVFHILHDIDVISSIVQIMSQDTKRELLNAKDIFGRMPLFYGNPTKHDTKLEFLLKNGATVNMVNTIDAQQDEHADPNKGRLKIGHWIYTEHFQGRDDSSEGQAFTPVSWKPTFSLSTIHQIYIHNWIAFVNETLFVPRRFDLLPTCSSNVSLVVHSHSEYEHSIDSSICHLPKEKEEHSANMNGHSCQGDTSGCPLDIYLVLTNKFNVKCLDILHKFDFQSESQNGVGENILHYLLLPQENIPNVKDLIVKLISHNSQSLTFINAKNKDGNTPLHIACSCRQKNKLKKTDRIEIVEALLQNGADVDVKNNCNESPLHCSLACICRTSKIVKLIIEKMTDISAVSKDGWTPLATLLSIQEYDESFIADSKLIVDLLFEKGASFDQIVSPIIPTYANGLLLDLIIKENPRPESFYELMANLVDLCVDSQEVTNAWVIVSMISNHTKITFNTFCRKIVENESKENLVIRKQKILKRCMRELKTITLVLYVVDFLFLENDDINKTDKNGNTFLINAVRSCGNIFHGICKLIGTFIQKGADINILNNEEKGLCYYLIKSHGSDHDVGNCLQILHKKGLVLNDNKILIWAAQANTLRTNVIHDLPDTINPDQKDELGTAFHHLIQSYARGSDMCAISVLELVHHGVVINAKNRDGETPLHLALRLNIRNYVYTELLCHYADVNVTNDDGLTPLHYILLHLDVRQLSTFREFMKFSGDLTVIDKKERDILYYTVSFMKPDTVPILSVILRKKVCDVNKIYHDGNNVLHTACTIKCIHEHIVTDTDDDCADDVWCTSLRVQVLRLLINFKANINVQDSLGRSVLHILVQQYIKCEKQRMRPCLQQMHSIIAMIALLVARGIDRAMQDQDGKTAINYLQDSNVQDLGDFINGSKSAEWMNDNTVKQVLSTRSMK